MGLMINPAPTFTLNDGSVASEGKLYFYENGSTAIKKDVFLTPNLDPLQKLNNPLTLTDAGRLPTCFGTGTYTIILESADEVQQWVRNDVTIDDLTGQFANYSPVKTYKVNEIVRYTDGNYYYSLSNNNKGNAPLINSEWWAQIAFLEFFNTTKATNEEYMLNDIVIYNGYLYRSLEDDNGDTPPSAKWANLTFNDSVAGNFAVGGDLAVTGEAKIVGGKIQIGPDVGPKYFINSDGEASDDDSTYEPIKTTALDEPQVGLTLTNNYTGTLRARVDDGILYIHGQVVSPGSIIGPTPYNTIATVPLAYRPDSEIRCVAQYRTVGDPFTPEIAHIQITVGGNINWYSAVGDRIIDFSIMAFQ